MELKKIREEKAVDSLVEQLKTGDYKKAKIKLGELMGNPAEFRKLFAFITKGTRYENVKLNIRRVPLKVDCFYCDWKGSADITEEGVRCPRCLRDVMILQGNELEIHL